MTNKCKPNEGHIAINHLQEECYLRGIKFNLITQNIDDYHAKLIKASKILPHSESASKPYAFTDGVIEVHGNVKYMRCNKGCTGFYDVPAKFEKESIPKCEKCGAIMRAHCLFFDECYNEEYYQAQTIYKIMEDCDLLIVAGTMLETSLPDRIVEEHLGEQKKIIEINIEPVLDEGEQVRYTKMPSEKSLPLIVESFINSINNVKDDKESVKKEENKEEKKKEEKKKESKKKETKAKLSSNMPKKSSKKK